MRDGIVLINPPPEKLVEEYDAPAYGHIGLAYLASSLRQNGFECAIIDAKLGRLSSEETAAMASSSSPRVIGITSHTHEIKTAAKLAADIKRLVPGAAVVIGGIHASCLPEETMRDFGSFDYLIKGEGEKSFVDLCERLIRRPGEGVGSVPGLSYRQAGAVVTVPPAAWIADLDAIPLPSWDLFPPMGIFPVISSRGCPFKCVFCARMHGETVRTRSAANVVRELDEIVARYGARRLYFYDETFGLNRKWLLEFLGLVISSGLGRKLEWGITTRANLIDEKILPLLKEAGCRKIDFGVESGDPKVLEVIKKGETLDDFIRAARLVRRAGITSHSYFILGHPCETKASAQNTIDFAARLNTDVISIGIMVPYPGTEVARLAQKGEGGYKKMSMDWSDYNKQLGNALELESLSRSELTRLQMLGYLKFYVRNLKIVPFIETGWKYRRLILAIVAKYIKSAIEEAKAVPR